MKRIISLILVMLMLFSCSAFAANDLNFLKERYTSAESTFECSFTLNKPLDFINELTKSDLYGMDMVNTMFDFSGLAESLFNSTSKGIVKVSGSADMKKVNISLESEGVTPAQINRNLLVTVNAKSGMWVELDFSDAKNPIYNLIVRTPVMDKYEVIDIVDMIKTEDGGEKQLEKIVSVYNLLVNDFTANGINSATVNLISDCAKVSYGSSAVTVSFDDAGFKKYLVGIIDTVNDIFKTADLFGVSDIASGNADIQLAENGLAIDSDTVKEFLSKVNILGKDGLVIRYGLSGNIINSIDTKTHISLNVGNIVRALSAAGEDAADEYAEDMAEDLKKYDAMNIDFTCNFNQNYRNINRGVKVEKPALTAENSFSLNELMKKQAEAMNEYVADMEYDCFGVYTEDYVPLGMGNAYIGVRELLDSTGIDFDIFYNNGVVSIVAPDDNYGFKKVTFTVGANTVNVDEAELALLNPTIERNDKVYVDSSFVLAVFNFDLSEITCYPTDGGLYCSFSKRSW